MNTTVHEGFIVVPYDGDSQAQVEVGFTVLVGEEPRQWFSAFMDYEGKQRVAKVIAPLKNYGTQTTYQVYLRVNGELTKAGKVVV
jgi:hypothetical protein